jgi:hypothetical protein
MVKDAEELELMLGAFGHQNMKKGLTIDLPIDIIMYLIYR